MKGVPGSVSNISWYSWTKAGPTTEARWPSAGLPRLQARFIWLWDKYKVWTDSAYFTPSPLAELRTLEMSRSTPVEDRREETPSAEEDSVTPIRTLKNTWMRNHTVDVGFGLNSWCCLVLDVRTSNLLVEPAVPFWTIALMSAQSDGTMSATCSTPDSWTPSTPSFSQKTKADWGDKKTVRIFKKWPHSRHLTDFMSQTLLIDHLHVPVWNIRDFEEETATASG